MIRALCLVLILANLGYLAWHSWIVPSQPSPIATPPTTARLMLEREAPPSASRAESPEAPAVAARCLSIGPFVDLAETAKTASALRNMGLSPRQRVVEGTVWAGYWVALDSPGSSQDAEAIVTRLRKAGIADSYIMPGVAGQGGTISLGLFTERRRAMTRVDEVRALGFEPRINPRQRTGAVYWIDVDTDDSTGPLDLVGSQGDAGRIVRLEIKNCGSGGAADVSTAPVSSTAVPSASQAGGPER